MRTHRRALRQNSEFSRLRDNGSPPEGRDTGASEHKLEANRGIQVAEASGCILELRVDRHFVGIR